MHLCHHTPYYILRHSSILNCSGSTFTEICSTDLVPTTLLLTEWGCSSSAEIINDLPFIDPPPSDALNKAYHMLVDLGALEEYKLPDSRRKRYKVTKHGNAIVKLPVHPRFATSIIKASELGPASLAAAVTAAALIDQDLVRGNEPNLALNSRDVLRGGPGSFNGKQLLKFASRVSDEAKAVVLSALVGEIQVAEHVGKALLPGFIDLIAQRKGDASYGGSTYMLSLGQSARLDDRQDEGEYVIVVDTSTGDDGKTRVRSYSKIESSVLQDVSSESEEVYAVESKGYQVRKRLVRKVGSLVLSSSTLPSPSSEEISEVLLDTIESLGGVSALLPMQPKKTTADLVELRERISLARSCSSDGDWPACFASLDAIQNEDGTDEDQGVLCRMIEPWLGAAGSLKAIDLLMILQSELSLGQQNELDEYFPIYIGSPDGSRIPITYNSERGPIASAKLQQFFGQSESPSVGQPGKSIPVSLSLLSPAGKPLAVTKDLPFFWSESYPSVRAEMRGRYPKHPWPDDPMDAMASRLTKKQQAARSSDNSGEKLDKRKQRNKERKKRK